MTNADKNIKIGDRVKVINYCDGNGTITAIQYKIKFDSTAYKETYYQENEIELLEGNEPTHEQLRELVDAASKYFIDVLKFDKKVVEETKEKFIKEYLKPTLTDDERVILRNIKNKEYKYTIGREDDTTYQKGKLYLRSQESYAKAFTISTLYNHLFQFIKEGEEYSIGELLNEDI